MIIPIFVPHEGCPNDCAFCNQHTISGQNVAPDLKEARETIDAFLENGKRKADQIAFFGGSFTGIEKEKQNEYLSLAMEYIKKGLVGSIRLSTRPDYIDEETLRRLAFYGVRNIELGAQSMDEDVLLSSRRGHSAKDVERAAEMIIKSGAILSLQMMTGLPLDSEEKCLYTARRFKELGAKETRIYPTVVLRGTLLEKMYEEGEYIPQSLEDAVEISAKLYRYFTDNGIEILRIGLPDSESLRENCVAGAYHPSLGEMVISRDVRNRLENELSESAEIYVNPRFISKFNGNKKCNIEYFLKKGIRISIIPDKSIKEYKIRR